jgi:predicted ATP-dependent serine protease
LRSVIGQYSCLRNASAHDGLQRQETEYDFSRSGKRAGFRLGKDVFLNITGGISVDDPAIDLAVVAAILSSNEDIPVDKGFVLQEKLGLSGKSVR